MTADSGRSPVECLLLDGFNARCILPAGLWRYRVIVEYVVGRVASHSAIAPRGSTERAGWVPLSYIEMDRLMGMHGAWSALRQCLIDAGVLESDEHYEIGRKCMWYRVGEKWRDHRVHRTVIRDTGLLEKLRGLQESREGLSRPQGPLARWLREVRVDEAAARPWTCQSERSHRQYLTALRIAVIQSGAAPLVVDDYGRCHTPVTNLRRTVRPALRIHGHELTELDIASAQPLLLGYVIGKVVIGDWSLERVKLLGARGPVSGAFEELELAPWSIEPPEDVLDFRAVCESGQFYRTLAQIWNLPIGNLREKKKVKRRVFRHLLFGRVRHENRPWTAFQRRWPNIASVLEQIKREDHGASARACQRLEARLMIDGVVEGLRLDHEWIPITTIHDSALVIADGAAIAIVEKLMGEEFGSIGLAPLIKRKVG
jgi:hypothetical protein